MKILLNGKEKEVGESLKLSELIDSLGIDLRTMAIGRNGTVVPKSEIEKINIQSGDQIDLVRFVAGG